VGEHIPFDQLNFGEVIGYALLNWVMLTVVRFVVVAAAYPILRNTGYSITYERAIVLVWGGLRGAIALAMAVMVESDEGFNKTDRSDVFLYVSSTVVITLFINAILTGPLLSFFGMDQKEKFQKDLDKWAKKDIAKHERSIKKKMEEESLSYQHANFDVVSKEVALFEAFDDEADSDEDIENKDDETDDTLKEKYYNVAKGQFLSSFLFTLDAFRKDGKISASALVTLRDSAETLLDPSGTPAAKDIKFEQWWDELIEPKLKKKVRFDTWQDKISSGLSCIPFFYTYHRYDTIHSIETTVEIAKGFRRCLRHVWFVMETSLHLADNDTDNRSILIMAMKTLKDQCAVMDVAALLFLATLDEEGTHGKSCAQYAVICYRLVETRRACQRIITYMMEKTHHLLEEGVLDHGEWEMISEKLHVFRRKTHAGHFFDELNFKDDSALKSAYGSDKSLRELIFPKHDPSGETDDFDFDELSRAQTTLHHDEDDAAGEIGEQDHHVGLRVEKHNSMLSEFNMRDADNVGLARKASHDDDHVY